VGAVCLSPFAAELEECGLSFAVLGNSLNKFKFSSLLKSRERKANRSRLLHCVLRAVCCP